VRYTLRFDVMLLLLQISTRRCRFCSNEIYVPLQIFYGAAAVVLMGFICHCKSWCCRFFIDGFSVDRGNGAAHQNTCPATDGLVKLMLPMGNKVQPTRIVVATGLGIENKVRSTVILKSILLLNIFGRI
jgi:hypothetical protein